MTAFNKPRLTPDYKGFFLNYLIKNMYLFFHFIYFPKPLSSKLWSAWVPVAMTSHARFLLKHSLLFAFNQSAGWLWGQARSPKGDFQRPILQTFPLFDSMQMGSALTRRGSIRPVNDIKYSKDTFWVKYWNQIGYKDPAQKSEHVCTCSAKGHKRAESFSPKVKRIHLWRWSFF